MRLLVVVIGQVLRENVGLHAMDDVVELNSEIGLIGQTLTEVSTGTELIADTLLFEDTFLSEEGSLRIKIVHTSVSCHGYFL
jgi:hypothetical protein